MLFSWRKGLWKLRCLFSKIKKHDYDRRLSQYQIRIVMACHKETLRNKSLYILRKISSVHLASLIIKLEYEIRWLYIGNHWFVGKDEQPFLIYFMPYIELWSFVIFHKTFLEHSIWICKWVSWWSHLLTFSIYFEYKIFLFFFCVCFFLCFFFLLKYVKVCPHFQIYHSKHYFAWFRVDIKQLLPSHGWNNYVIFFFSLKIVRQWHHQLIYSYIHIDSSRNV